MDRDKIISNQNNKSIKDDLKIFAWVGLLFAVNYVFSIYIIIKTL